MFEDRQNAGQRLGAELDKFQLRQPVVLALLRGGVPVAVEVAKTLNAPLDLLIVRKVGAPGNPELAVAAIVDGNPPDVVLNREIIEAYSLDNAALGPLISAERPELERQRMLYLGKRKPVSVAGKTVIVVDDGAVTGTTIKVAIRALRRRSPREVVVALPVSASDAMAELVNEADRVVCLGQPARFRTLSYHFLRFPEVTDREIVDAMAEAALAKIGRSRMRKPLGGDGTQVVAKTKP